MSTSEKKSDATPQTLRDLINSFCRERRIKPRELAAILGENYNSWRNWHANNKYPPHVVAKLSEWMGIPLNKDIATFEETRGSSSALPDDPTGKSLDALIEMHRSASLKGLPIPPITAFFKSMRLNDVFVMSTWDEIPEEWELNDWMNMGVPLCEAISEGAFFIYFSPNEVLAKHSMESINGPATFGTRFKVFQAEVRRRLVKMKSDPALSETNLLYIPTQIAGMAMCGHKVCLYRDAATAELGMFGMVPSNSAQIVCYDHKHSDKMVHYVRTALMAAPEHNGEELFSMLFLDTRDDSAKRAQPSSRVATAD